LASWASERLRSTAAPFESSGDGTGIGLFVIRDVLQQLDGRIEVQSRDASSPEGQGTTFTVSIPARQILDSAAPLRSGESVDSLSVLVVDDLADVRDALSDVTRRLGHACRAVGNAVEARVLLASTYFDAVLIDLEMPETDGLTLATEIRQGGGLNASSMLILISAAENQAVGQAWPFDGFLQKPIDGRALGRLIGMRTSH
jgi:CheY-like chemotaxis protein